MHAVFVQARKLQPRQVDASNCPLGVKDRIPVESDLVSAINNGAGVALKRHHFWLGRRLVSPSLCRDSRQRQQE